MIVHAVPQRSPEWFALRLGRLTGSRASDMLAKIQKGEAAGRRNLRVQLVLEQLTGVSQDSDFVSPSMQHGIDTEAAACAAYEAQTGCLISPVGFVQHDTLPAGCSPDGQIDDFTGLLELKCCKSATHLGFLKSRTVPGEYLSQIQHNLWITGAQWCDYVSFDDKFPDPLRLLVVRVPRIEIEIVAYERCVLAFLDEVNQEVREVLKLSEAAV